MIIHNGIPPKVILLLLYTIIRDISFIAKLIILEKKGITKKMSNIKN